MRINITIEGESIDKKEKSGVSQVGIQRQLQRHNSSQQAQAIRRLRSALVNAAAIGVITAELADWIGSDLGRAQS